MTEQIRYNQIKTVHKIEDVPALKKEAFVGNVENYRCTLEQELQRIRYEDQPDKKFAQTWQDVAADIYKHEDFGKQLLQKDYFEAELSQVIDKLNTREDKLEAVFKFVKAKIKWDGNYSAYTKKGVRKAYAERVGNIAEINFILIAMLNYAGINASPVVLSTVSNGISTFPNRTAFNYIVVSADIDGKRSLLDASSDYSYNNILPLHALNWVGRLIRNDGTSEEIELVPNTLSRASTNVSFKVDKSGFVTGKIRIQKSDHLAFEHRQLYNKVNKNLYLEKLENEYGKIEIEDYEVEGQYDLKKPIVESFGFTSRNSVESIGDRMYFSPMLFFATQTNPFLMEKREYPIEFGFPTENRYYFAIDIPDGYTIESLPETINLVTEGKIITFKYIVSPSANKIQISITFSNNSAVVHSDYYLGIKDFFQKMVDKENEKIVLKRYNILTNSKQPLHTV